MSQQLINLNEPLKRLRDEGYEIAVSGGYVCIHHIPYVTNDCSIKYGSLVTELNLSDPNTLSNPRDHTMNFQGDAPCDKNGQILREIINNSTPRNLGLITVNHLFSSKPKSGFYVDYYEKFITYIRIITGPAQAIDKNAHGRTFKIVDHEDENSVFNYPDTNSSRANIEALNDKFRDENVGIIGLGGTGSYILDFLAKTPVNSISIFDGDIYLVHNAFRNPGASSIEDLNSQRFKVDNLHAIYSQLHKGIKAYPEYIKEDNLNYLNDLSYVFISIDDNEARAVIVGHLLSKGISFTDVGLGINLVEDTLVGAIRVTSVDGAKSDHVKNRIPMENNDDNDYTTNIQIAELNAFNASMAVQKWKKSLGFYQDLLGAHHSTYSLNDSLFLNDET